MSSFSHKSFEEQVALLESRGMLFSGEQDKKKAEQKLSIISYYKLKEFARPFSKIVTVDGVRQINYQNTPFKKLLLDIIKINDCVSIYWMLSKTLR